MSQIMLISSRFIIGPEAKVRFRQSATQFCQAISYTCPVPQPQADRRGRSGPFHGASRGVRGWRALPSARRFKGPLTSDAEPY
jgi:hypothetical protein